MYSVSFVPSRHLIEIKCLFSNCLNVWVAVLLHFLSKLDKFSQYLVVVGVETDDDVDTEDDVEALDDVDADDDVEILDDVEIDDDVEILDDVDMDDEDEALDDVDTELDVETLKYVLRCFRK